LITVDKTAREVETRVMSKYLGKTMLKDRNCGLI